MCSFGSTYLADRRRGLQRLAVCTCQVLLFTCLFQVRRQRADLNGALHPQRAPKSPASQRLSEAIGLNMEVCSPTGELAGRIRRQDQWSRRWNDHPQQLRGRRTPPATHTRAHRIRATYHWKVYPYAGTAAAPD